MKKDNVLENVCKFLMRDDRNATYDEALAEYYSGDIARESVVEACTNHLNDGIAETDGKEQEQWKNMLAYLKGAN